MRKLALILLLLTSTLYLPAQEKPPVAVDDTVYFPVSYKPHQEYFFIYPLGNDYSQEMHPIRVISASIGMNGGVITDSAIKISYLQLDQNYSFIYYIQDLENGLISEPGQIHIIVETESYDWLNINNMNARINSSGHHFSDYLSEGDAFFFECPKGSQRHTFGYFRLLLAGYDSEEQLHMAPSGRYYWTFTNHCYRPGPLSNEYPMNYDENWEKVWKVNKDEIEYHKYHYQDPGYKIPEDILDWPAHGDTTNGQASVLAPFEDLDGDGCYEPMDGEYPVTKGDQSVYFIFNDDRRGYSGDTVFIGLEVHGEAYAYDCAEDSIFNNAIFLDYKIINRSEMNLHDVYTGINPYLSVGSYWDNFTGCDTSLHAVYAYNATNFDTNIYSPSNLGYGSNPPAQGLTYLNQPLSHFNNNYWPNGGGQISSAITPPREPNEFYNYLTGKWIDGTPITYGEIGYGGNAPCNHVFPDDPNDPNGWSMFDAAMDPMNYNYSTASTGPFSFNSGDTIPLEMAIVFARDYDGDHLSCVTLLRERIKALRAYYFSDSIPCHNGLGSGESELPPDRLMIYPNPASGKITIQGSKIIANAHIYIYDVTGKFMMRKQTGTQQQLDLDVATFPSGIYFAILRNDTQIIGAGKFVIR